MKKIDGLSRSLLLGAFLALIGGTAAAQDEAGQDSAKAILQEVVISDAHLRGNTPLTMTSLNRGKLEEAEADISLPYMIEMQPSVVASGENGKMGNSTFRMRGVDGTRINVSLNGIPLNDAESQMVYWVNIPDLDGMAQSVQLQRGVGNTVGGAASFGGAMSILTRNAKPEPHAEATLNMGSWNTRQYGVRAGTGLGERGWGLEAAYNGLTSDGFVRNGFCDHQSLFLTGGHYGEKSVLKGIVIAGKQHTGITWDGAYDYQLDEDPAYNPAGGHLDTAGNMMYYDNQSDNYFQRHYQLCYSRVLGEKWGASATGDITLGDGYYEEYHDDEAPSAYGLEGMMSSGTSDFIVQKKMRNRVLTECLSAHYEGDRLSFSAGETLLSYGGDNFGEVVWAQDCSAISASNAHEWYRNRGEKQDLSAYLRANWSAGRGINLFGEVMGRAANYSIAGPDNDHLLGADTVDFDERYRFLNPKAGINWAKQGNGMSHHLYFVANMIGREPTRADILNAVKTHDTVRAEHLLDMELGYSLRKRSFAFSANGYAMLYKDQLTASGELNSDGFSIMVNVDRSYRLGMELQGEYHLTEHLDLGGNLTLSRNKILGYTYYGTELGNTDLSFSPAVVGAAMADYHPGRDWKFQIAGKYVGSQYCDNTSRENMKDPAYFLLNAKIGKSVALGKKVLRPDPTERLPRITVQLALNNLLNHQYRITAWAADYGDGSVYRAYYQQPGFNAMICVKCEM